MKLKVLILVLLLAVSTKQIKASHIVGGDLTYLYIGNNNYEITLHLYVDCVNGSPQVISRDTTAIIVIYDVEGNLVDSLGMYRNKPQRVDQVAYNCVIPPRNACVNLYIYKDTINLPPISGGYSIAFQRCCRNTTINNITNPVNTGSTYLTHISDTVDIGANSSPVFDSLPPNFLCVSYPLIFNHTATDPDGDSLAYELCMPFDGDFSSGPRPLKPSPPPYPTVNWKTPYSLDNVMGGTSKLTINSKTGELTVTPDEVGQFVVGVRVNEYRNGKLIGSTIRDYQLNVVNCNFEVRSSFTAPSLTCSRDVFFENLSNGADSYKWNFGVDGIDTDSSSDYKPTYIYPDTGNFVVQLIAKNKNCTDTFKTTVSVVDEIKVFAGNDTTMCIGDTIRLGEKNPSNLFTYKWQGGSGLTDYDIPNPKSIGFKNNSYILNKTSGNCLATDTVNIIILNPRAAFTSRASCNMEIQFSNESIGATSYLWSFGGHENNSDTSTETAPKYVYGQAAEYSVNLKAINGGCYHEVSEIVTVEEFSVFAGRDTFLCPGEKITLGIETADTNFNYLWESVEYLDNPAIPTPISKPLRSIAYIVTKTDRDGCEVKDSVDITVANPTAMFDTTTDNSCEGVEFRFTNQSEYASGYKWIYSNGEEAKETEPNPVKIGYEEEFKVSLIAINKGCADTLTRIYTTPSLFLLYNELPNVFTPGTDGFNDCFKVTNNPAIEDCYELIIFNRWGEILFTKSEDGSCWKGDVAKTGEQVPEGTYYYIFKVGGKDRTGTIKLIR